MVRMSLNAHVQNPKADFCAFIGIRVRAGSMQVKMFVAIRALKMIFWPNTKGQFVDVQVKLTSAYKHFLELQQSGRG